MNKPSVKIGDTLIFYDRYTIKSEQIQRWKVYGETKKFWLCGSESNCRKVIKNGLISDLQSHGVVFTEEQWHVESIKAELLPQLRDSISFELWAEIAKLMKNFKERK